LFKPDSQIRIHPAIDAMRNPPCGVAMKLQRHSGSNFSRAKAREADSHIEDVDPTSSGRLHVSQLNHNDNWPAPLPAA